jgi:spermidine synthase
MDSTISRYFQWLRLCLPATICLPLATASFGILSFPTPASSAIFADTVFPILYCLAVFFGWIGSKSVLVRWQRFCERQGRLLERFIDILSVKHSARLIVVASAMSLLAELIFIRWQASLFNVLSYCKNFTLLSCFAGLSIGYAASKKRLIFPACIPLIAFAVGSFVVTRFLMPDGCNGCFHTMPFFEELAMGTNTANLLAQIAIMYVFLATVFAVNVLIFFGFGQLCGRLMEKPPILQAYGLNLIGSILGVLVMLGLSELWTPPSVWFAALFAAIVPFCMQTKKSLLQSALIGLACIASLSAITPFATMLVYSPYQMIEVTRGEYKTIITLRTGGAYHQRIIDLSKEAQTDEVIKLTASYYELPYAFRPAPKEVLIIGAGTGNDITAAINCGASSIDAVEIDPAIQALGKNLNPDKPYDDPRVTAILDDARHFLQTSHKKYDLIVFGLLDSHIGASEATQLRMDSYVYTLESMRSIKDHLKDSGLVCLSFSTVSKGLDAKIEKMLKTAFGTDPLCIRQRYDQALTMVEPKNGTIEIPQQILDKQTQKILAVEKIMADEQNPIDISTDDWPFFYMAHKQFPTSYVPMLSLILALSLGLLITVNRTAPSMGGFVFLLLGTGFMLIETKGITELGLYFGNTWYVSGIIISAVLIMAYVSNLFVERAKITNPLWAGLGLITSLVLGLYLHHTHAISPDTGGKLLATVILTLPMAFSGILFSVALRRAQGIGSAMSMNIIGALLGGAIEYLSLLLGYEALYVVALVVYVAALCMLLRNSSSEPQVP